LAMPSKASQANPPAQQVQRLGEILIENGWLDPVELDSCLAEAKQTGTYLGYVLVKREKISKEQLGKALSKQFNLQYISLANLEIDRGLLKLLPEEFMREHQVLPIAKEGGRLVVAMVEPRNRRVFDEITFITGIRPQVLVTTSFEFKDTFNRVIQSGASSNLLSEVSDFSSKTGETRHDLVRQQQKAEMMDTSNNPLAKLVNSIIEEGIEKGASDVHIEPRESASIVRFRLNGILKAILEVPLNMEASLITRIKVMSRMDISEHRKPQDGRITIHYKGTDYNLRVNTLPIGETGREKVVIRILRPSKNILDFADLGFTPAEVKKLEMMYKAPYGIVLMCGPTGSGKTTTLYTMLHKINEEIRNISTVEDPIELKIEGLNQSQVNSKAEFGFSTALRALLRQDPDVIMVGEIRDLETLEAAIHASLTGHLVFSTVHANTTAATVTRLVEMGAEPSLISSSLLGVVAQRLIRTLCKNCKVPHEATLEEKQVIFPLDPEKHQQKIILHHGKGCNLCGSSGYAGRSGIYEIMLVDRTIRHLVSERKLDIEIEDAAVASGMRTLNISGLRLLLEGKTSLEEVVRTLGPALGRTL
jgi:type IV pilus assembly protein PilB